LAAPAKRTIAVLSSNEGKPRNASNAAPAPVSTATSSGAPPAFGAAAVPSNPVPPPANPYPPAQPSAGLGTSFSPPADAASVGADAGSNTPRPRNLMKDGRVEGNLPK
jgi:hypothetical protein